MDEKEVLIALGVVAFLYFYEQTQASQITATSTIAGAGATQGALNTLQSNTGQIANIISGVGSALNNAVNLGSTFSGLASSVTEPTATVISSNTAFNGVDPTQAPLATSADLAYPS